MATWAPLGAEGGRDWDEFLADLTSARSALLGGELPFWMPYRWGGHDAWADPQSCWASPLGAGALLLGVPLAARLFPALCAAVACLGIWRLGARLGLGPTGRVAAGVVYALSPRLALAAAGGVPTFLLGQALLPWLFAALLGGARRELAWGGALLALDLYGGDVNYFVFHALALGALAAGLASWRRTPRPLVGAAALLLAAGLLAAPKLVPTAWLARRHPRETSEVGRGALTGPLLARLLLERDAAAWVARPGGEFVGLDRQGALRPLRDLPGPEAVAPGTAVDLVNAGAYLGWLALGLAALGAARAMRGAGPRGAPGAWAALAGVAVLALWLGWGSNATPSAWAALRGLPVFRTLRAPDRLVLYPFLVLCLAAGLGLDLVRAGLRGRWGAGVARGGAALVLILLAFDVHLPARLAARASFPEPPLPALSAAPFEQRALAAGPWGTRYGPPSLLAARGGFGAVNGYGGAPPWRPCHVVPRGAPGYRGEAVLARGPGRVGELQVGARGLALQVELAGADQLLLNHNAAPGWALVSPPGGRLLTRHGRLAVELPPGRHQVLLRYTPPGLWWGLALFCPGLALLLALLRPRPEGSGSG